MIHAKTLIHFLALLLLVSATGCAPAYRSYSGCYVNCHYCAPPPMPYVHYDTCTCHSCVASAYVSARETAVEAQNDRQLSGKVATD